MGADTGSLVSFITRVPDEPGALQQVAGVITRHRGNITRIHYDRRIDRHTVFFEVEAPERTAGGIREDLAAMGILQTSLPSMGHLKMHIHIPHQPGSLAEFLEYITSCRANIAYTDFDHAGPHPNRLTIGLDLAQGKVVDELLDTLKSRYRIEILEYDTTGRSLDDTVFYLRFAQELREFVGEAGDEFLLRFLHDINHIVQELSHHGEEPVRVLDSVIQAGRTLHATTGPGFYADVQMIPLSRLVTLHCFQLPCGGNIFALSTPKDLVMVDTGYGIYHDDVMRMIPHTGLDITRLSRIIVTHGDADHCGAAGHFHVDTWMHPGTEAIIRVSNRAYGSSSEESVLEQVYTRMIGLFSRFSPPERVRIFPTDTGEGRGAFSVLDRVTIGDLEFEVLESLGGHQFGEIFLCSPEAGVIFAADTVINFESLTPERRSYNTLAVILVTSVNVDSHLARQERQALLELARACDRGEGCLICGGHGAISVLAGDSLREAVPAERYIHAG